MTAKHKLIEMGLCINCYTCICSACTMDANGFAGNKVAVHPIVVWQ